MTAVRPRDLFLLIGITLRERRIVDIGS